MSLFLQSFSLALRSNDQFKASPWSTLFFFVFFGRIGGATRWRVCYQQGLPRLVSGIIQNPIVSVWYYHMPFSVMLKHKWCTVFFTACRVLITAKLTAVLSHTSFHPKCHTEHRILYAAMSIQFHLFYELRHIGSMVGFHEWTGLSLSLVLSECWAELK